MKTLVRREWTEGNGAPSKWPIVLGITGGLALLFTILGIWACCRTRVRTTVKARLFTFQGEWSSIGSSTGAMSAGITLEKASTDFLETELVGCS